MNSNRTPSSLYDSTSKVPTSLMELLKGEHNRLRGNVINVSSISFTRGSDKEQRLYSKIAYGK